MESINRIPSWLKYFVESFSQFKGRDLSEKELESKNSYISDARKQFVSCYSEASEEELVQMSAYLNEFKDYSMTLLEHLDFMDTLNNDYSYFKKMDERTQFMQQAFSSLSSDTHNLSISLKATLEVITIALEELDVFTDKILGEEFINKPSMVPQVIENSIVKLIGSEYPESILSDAKNLLSKYYRGLTAEGVTSVTAYLHNYKLEVLAVHDYIQRSGSISGYTTQLLLLYFPRGLDNENNDNIVRILNIYMDVINMAIDVLRDIYPNNVLTAEVIKKLR